DRKGGEEGGRHVSAGSVGIRVTNGGDRICGAIGTRGRRDKGGGAAGAPNTCRFCACWGGGEARSEVRDRRVALQIRGRERRAGALLRGGRGRVDGDDPRWLHCGLIYGKCLFAKH